MQLSEVKVDRAVSELSTAWRLGANRNPSAARAATLESGASSAASGTADQAARHDTGGEPRLSAEEGATNPSDSSAGSKSGTGECKPSSSECRE